MYKRAIIVMCMFIQIDARAAKIYDDERTQLFAEESYVAVGGSILLNGEEKKANNILMAWKLKELEDGFNHPEHFNLSKHYFTYREDIPKSKVYQIIKKMPKGAALHIHSSMMLDVETLVDLTYEPNLFICFGEKEFRLEFSLKTPQKPCNHQWSLLSQVRAMSDNDTRFDSEIRQFFAMHAQDPDGFINTDINTVWKGFDKVYYAIKSLITYRPVKEKYIYQSLKKFYEDNIMYVELRTGLHPLYELDGTVHDRKYSLELYKRVVDEFTARHPDFLGAKIIVSRHRQMSEKQIKETISSAKAFKAAMPDFIAGFDLVGQEDLGKPLSAYLPLLVEAKDDLDYFLHAGETAWYGTPSDENIFDAVLLGSKRIGHAYALVKHPSLIQTIIKKNIAIEVNVISNNVLSLIHDVRNHPLAIYLAMGLPVVLSSDDPGAWGAEPLSHDYFVAFMGVASRRADLRMLKKLAYNSIEYSALDDRKKASLKSIFEKRWQKFIKDVIATHVHLINS